jgi:hypothetical protein
VPADGGEPLRRHLDANGVTALVYPPKLRLVTHLDVDAAAIDRATTVFGDFFRKAAAAD